MNGTRVGSSITQAQWLRLVDPGGGPARDVLVIADSGSENCQADFNISPYSFGDKAAKFTMKTLAESTECDTGVGSFQLQSRRNPNIDPRLGENHKK